MPLRQDDVIVRVQIANSASRSRLAKPSYRITIPNLGVEYYRRVIHPDGRIEFIPVDFMESSVGTENGN